MSAEDAAATTDETSEPAEAAEDTVPVAEAADEPESAPAEPGWYSDSDTIETEVVPPASAPDAETVEVSAMDAPAESLTVLAGASVLEFRQRMHAAQEQFTQAAVEAVSQAAIVVTDAVAAVHQALSDEAAAAGSWQQSEQPDPDQLDRALGRYNTLLDRLLSL